MRKFNHLFLLLIFMFIFSPNTFSQKNPQPDITEFRFNQKQTCKVIDRDTQQPIAFVNAGVVKKENGTVTNEHGDFTLWLYDNLYDDTLRISHPGYESFNMDVRSFVNEKTDSVSLRKSEKILEKAERPAKFKEKIFGNNKNKHHFLMSFENENNGFELGVLLPVKKRTYLKEFNLNVRQCTHDSVFFRINVYRKEGKHKFENILNEPIYVGKKINENDKKISFDLTPCDIVIKEPSLVTFEQVKENGEGKIVLIGQLFGKRAYGRYYSQHNIEKFPLMTFAIHIKADVEK